MRDLHNHIGLVPVIHPASVSNDDAQVGTVVDLQGYNACVFGISIGSVADSNATFTTLLEESDDNSTYAAVADADLNGTEALASFQYDSDNTMRKLGYVGNKRYVRLTITPSGNGSAAVFGAFCILGHPMHGPVGNPSSVND